jgi:hypothetical protein
MPGQEEILETPAATPQDAENPSEGNVENPPDAQAAPEGSDANSDEKKRDSRIPQWRLDEVTRARREAERERDRLAAELAAERSRAQTKAEPRVDPDFPTVPDYETFTGTHEEWLKILKEIPSKAKAYIESQQAAQREEQLFKAATSSFQERVAKLPDLKAITEAVNGTAMSQEAQGFIGAQLVKIKNGPEVMREIFLDPELHEELVELDKFQDAQGIISKLHAVSMALRIASKKLGEADADTDTDDPPKPATQAPAPLKPLKKSSPTATGLDDDLPWNEWVKRRNAQIAANKR